MSTTEKTSEMSLDYTRRLQKIEEVLFRTVPWKSDSSWIARVAGAMRAPTKPPFVDKINAPNLELLKRGGKRWRPLVLVLIYEMLEGKNLDLAYQLTPLVELPHNGSLIVDDIEDRSDERRGGPAIHLMYGVDMAINSGNFLYFLPTYLLDELPELGEKEKGVILHYYLEVMRRLHFGQGLDIQWHNDNSFVPEVEDYLQMCRFKTGSLSRLSAQIGAAAAGASRKICDEQGALWEDIGVGFQIMDDVKNLVTGNPGKLRGDDIVEGKKSLPVIYHCQDSADGGAQLLKLFEGVRSVTGNEQRTLIEEAISRIEDTGSLVKAEKRAMELLQSSQILLKGSHGGHPSGILLNNLVEGFVRSIRGS